VRLVMPGAPGAYALRYVTAHDARVLARRSITIEKSEANVSGPAQVHAASALEVSWAGPAGEGDYVTITTPTGTAEDYLSYAHTSEPKLAFRAPPNPGTYELRYIQAAPEGHKILARAPLAVGPPQVSLDAPADARNGADITLRFRGPCRSGDC